MNCAATIVGLAFCAVSCDSSRAKTTDTSSSSSVARKLSASKAPPEDARAGEDPIADLLTLRRLACECRTSACLASAYELRHGILPRLEGRARSAAGFEAGEMARLLKQTSDCLPSRAQEGRDGVERIYTAARAYYISRHDRDRGQASFPPSSAGPTPPLGTCCKNGGACDPDARLWAGPEWRALAFSVDRPHFYSFEYRVGQASGPDATFTARAIGDLDCDGSYSTFQMVGDLKAGQGAPQAPNDQQER
jgi:hypothetical protein